MELAQLLRLLLCFLLHCVCFTSKAESGTPVKFPPKLFARAFVKLLTLGKIIVSLINRKFPLKTAPRGWKGHWQLVIEYPCPSMPFFTVEGLFFMLKNFREVILCVI